MNVVSLPLDMIDPGERLREVDDDYARIIAVSMGYDGQRTPIEVRAAGPDGRHTLIAGAHRLRAVEMAGLDTVLCVILNVDELQAQRLEIEENLCRFDLSELDRVTFLGRWKEVYEALHERVRHGGRRNKKQEGQTDLLTVERFTKVAADRLGLSEKTIKRAQKRFKRLSPEARKLISGTWLADHAAELDLLTEVNFASQAEIVRAMRDRGANSIKALVYAAMNRRTPEIDPDTAQFDAVMKAWRKASAKARARFRAELAKDEQFNLGDAA